MFSIVILIIMSLTKVVEMLPLVERFFTRYGLSTLLAMGNFGTLCNIIIFSTSQVHRANPCSLYLLAAECSNFIAINFGLIIILYSLDHQDPSNMFESFCKIKVYIIHIVFNISRWLVVLACADRFALSHKQAHIRSWSSTRIARRAIILVIGVWILIAIHVPIWQGIHFGVCGPYGVYGLIWSIYLIIVAGILPPFAMIVFGFLTFKNLNSIRSRVQSRTNSTRFHLHSRDINLMRMVLAEIFVYILTNIAHPLRQLYMNISDKIISEKSCSRKQIEAFIFYITTSFLIYTYFCSTFYIYITASRSFRQDFKRLFTCFTGSRIAIASHRNERKRSRQTLIRF